MILALALGTTGTVGTTTTGSGVVGDYWVGTGKTATFATLGDAIAALDAGNVGAGSRFLLDDSQAWVGSWVIAHDITIQSDGSPVTVTAGAGGDGNPALDGIFLANGATVTVAGLTLDGLDTYRIGGAMKGGTLVLDGVDAKDGAANQTNGPLFTDDSGAISLLGSTVRSSHAIDDAYGTAGDGGAVAVASGGQLLATDTRFEANTSDADGGAVWCEGSCTVVDSVFVGNVAGGDGGAMWFGVGAVELQRSLLCDNNAKHGGGLLIDAAADIGAVQQNVFCENDATSGGGVWSRADALFLLNNDFVGNTALTDATAIGMEGASLLSMNGIYAFDDAALNVATGPVALDYALFHLSGPFGAGVTVSDAVLGDPDPLFVGYIPGDCEGSDFQLDVNSPALGAGDGSFSDDLGAFPCGGVEVVGDEIDGDCDGAELCWEDLDGDGYGTDVEPSADTDCDDVEESTSPEDCAPSDPNVHPDATEGVADLVDQDCDNAELCWVDLDGDGFGVPIAIASSDYACTGDGVAANAEDCDDQDPAVGADPRVWHPDADGDTFGDPAISETQCGPRSGWVGDGTDCDDADRDTYPGAADLDACDGVDWDCDGTPEADCGGSTGTKPVPGGAGGESGAVIGGVCGCATPGPPGGWILAAFAATLVRRRAR